MTTFEKEDLENEKRAFNNFDRLPTLAEIGFFVYVDTRRWGANMTVKKAVAEFVELHKIGINQDTLTRRNYYGMMPYFKKTLIQNGKYDIRQ